MFTVLSSRQVTVKVHLVHLMHVERRQVAAIIYAHHGHLVLLGSKADAHFTILRRIEAVSYTHLTLPTIYSV